MPSSLWQAILAEFILGLGEGLAVHQGFGLCKEVAEQLLVMVADLVMAVGRGDEVARNHLGALVEFHVVFEADAERDGKCLWAFPAQPVRVGLYFRGNPWRCAPRLAV